MKTKNPVTLPQLVQGMLFSMQADGRAKRTWEYYDKLLTHLLQFAREQHWPGEVRDLDVTHIRQFLAWVGQRTISYEVGHGGKRVAQARPSVAWPYYKAVRRLFNWAIEEHLLSQSPAATIRFKAPPQAPIQPYSSEEIKALLNVCRRELKYGIRLRGARDIAMILLFLDSGLRLKEMTGLKLTDINLQEQYVSILGKGNKPDFCPFSKPTAVALWSYLKERNPLAKTHYLWITEAGSPFTQDGIASRFSHLKNHAGVISPGRVHRLRHTAALQYLRGAKDSFLLQLFLRHSDLAMTRRYTQGLKKEEAIWAHRHGASPVERLGIS